MSPNILNEEESQFRDFLLKLKNDPTNIVRNSNEGELRAKEGKVIVLRGNTLPVIIFFGVFIAVIISMHLTFLRFDFRTLLILYSVWFVCGSISFLGILNNLFILHPDGFLYRRFIFSKFSQKWKNLISQPVMEKSSGSEGGTYYHIKFAGGWGIKKYSISSLKIKGIKRKNEKMEFIEKLVLSYYDRAHSP